MRKFLFLLPACFIIVGLYYYTHPRKVWHDVGSSQLTCYVIHKPATGCPPNWREAVNAFTEKDGSKQSACIAPPEAAFENCIDLLYPGEVVRFEIPTEVPHNSPPHDAVEKQ